MRRHPTPYIVANATGSSYPTPISFAAGCLQLVLRFPDAEQARAKVRQAVTRPSRKFGAVAWYAAFA